MFEAAAQGRPLGLALAWLGVTNYALQLYLDMALGISRMFNIRLPLNFDSPYKSRNIVEFWRRRHMTLSAFLRDYLSLPLGGNRRGTARRYAWRGAAALPGRLATGVGVTFAAVLLAWVPFRAESMATTLLLWRSMFGLNGVSLPGRLQSVLPAQWSRLRYDGLLEGFFETPGQAVAWVALGLAIIWALPNSQQWAGAGRRAERGQRLSLRPVLIRASSAANGPSSACCCWEARTCSTTAACRAER